MSRLLQNSTWAERDLFCRFAETFESSDAVIENMGSISGSPAIDGKCTFDGSTDYITYDLRGSELNASSLSIVIKFNPDFASNDGAYHYFLDTTASNISVYKRNDDSLRVIAGTTTILNIANGTYASYWNINQENTLVVSATSGTNEVWLNGTSIGTSATAWSATAPVSLVVGANLGVTAFHSGTISEVKIFQYLLTEQDAINLYNEDVYEYYQSAVINLPMISSTHDPTNVQSLDISGLLNPAQLGDGSTSSTYPTKLSKRGYSVATGDYFTQSTLTGDPFNNSQLSLLIFFTPDYEANDGVAHYIFDTTNGSRTLIRKNSTNNLDVYAGGTTLVLSSAIASYQDLWRSNSYNTIIASCDSSGNNHLYVNGVEVASSSTSWTPQAVTDYYIGVQYALNFPSTGEFHQVTVFQASLTALQVKDLHRRMMSEVNYNG